MAETSDQLDDDHLSYVAARLDESGYADYAATIRKAIVELERLRIERDTALTRPQCDTCGALLTPEDVCPFCEQAKELERLRGAVSVVHTEIGMLHTTAQGNPPDHSVSVTQLWTANMLAILAEAAQAGEDGES
jgi:RNA polymerase subunit RPABC4/transcription elongation factor Spt4